MTEHEELCRRASEVVTVQRTRREPVREGHTPGPWQVMCLHGALKSEASAYAVCGHHRLSLTRRAANARLIACAPDLLAAIKGLFEHCVMAHKHWGEGSNQKEADAAIAAGLAAIANAEGRMP